MRIKNIVFLALAVLSVANSACAMDRRERACKKKDELREEVAKSLAGFAREDTFLSFSRPGVAREDTFLFFSRPGVAREDTGRS